jgi:zinc transporter ZupT
MTERRPNYLGIIAGTIVLFAFGAVWYIALGGAWQAAVGVPKDVLAAAGFMPFVISFVAGLLISYCFDNMLWHYERADASKGAQVGVLIGVCIYVPMVAMLYSYAQRSMTLFLIDAGYGLIGFVLTGAVVGWLRGRRRA